MATIIQLRNDTAANFTTYNPVLAQGEIGLELDTKKIKVGDGVKTWNQLDYWVGPLTSEQVIAALGYTPYDSSNPDGYISGITSSDVIEALGFTPYSDANPDGYISGITSSDVTTALGYTPYDSSNPAGYTDNVGTVTSVNNVQPVNGNVTIDLSGKVDKTTTADRVYGTDAQGNQTTYDKNSFGQVDDVTVGGTSVVTNKVAVLGSMAGETASDYATAAQGALADSAIQTINNIAPVDGNATIEAGTGLKLSGQNEFDIMQEDLGSTVFEIKGTLTESDGVYSGFSNLDYIEVNRDITIGATDDVEIVFCGTTTYSASSSNTYCYGGSYCGIYLQYGNYDSLQWYIPGEILGIQPTGSINIFYSSGIKPKTNSYSYFKLKRSCTSSSTIITLYYSSDGVDWIEDTIKTYTDITYRASRTGIIKLGQIGGYLGYWNNGNITLNKCSMKINGEYVWNPSSNVYKEAAKATTSLYGLVKPDGSTIVVNDGVISSAVTGGDGIMLNQGKIDLLQSDFGSDTSIQVVGNLSKSGYVYSGFSTSNYLKLPSTLTLNPTDSFEMVVKFKASYYSSGQSALFTMKNTNNTYHNYRLYSSNPNYGWRFYRSSRNGGSTDSEISRYYIDGDTSDEYRYIKIVRTIIDGSSTKYQFYGCKDGVSWVLMNTTTISELEQVLTFNEIDLGCYLNNAASTYFRNGTIDLSGWYIKKNGEYWWNPSKNVYKPVAKATDSLYGLVKPDNLSITVNDGVISASITDNVTSTSTTSALSANMGKELQDQVDNLKARGRFLALWDCSTGLAETHPTVSPYEYKAGDYFIVGIVAQEGGTNYKPSGSSYTDNVPSTAIETGDVSVDDVYYYDGNVWHLQYNTRKEVAFANIAGDPYDNSNLASALNDKQDELPSQTGQSGKFLTTNGTAISWGDVTIPVTDVQINSTSILSSGVANIPVGTSSVLGVYKVNPNQGISAYSAGDLVIISANESEIIAKTHNYKPIVPSKLDIAVREGLGNNSLTWTDAYKANARNTIGATQAVFVDWSE